MYLKLNDGIVEKYPYSIESLKSDNPQTSFPADISLEVLAEWNVYPVEEKTPPEINYSSQSYHRGAPILENGQWVETWVVQTIPQEEQAARREEKAAEVRTTRNALISECDWTQLDDTPITNAKKLEWATYRQALRDVPSQEGFPWTVNWPAKP